MSADTKIDTEPKVLEAIVVSEDGDDKKTWSTSEKASLMLYEFTDLIRYTLEPTIGKTIESLRVCFVPADHKHRGIYDMGWRILITFVDDDETMLIIDPTACYAKAVGGVTDEEPIPDDIRLQNLLDDLNSKYATGEVVSLVTERDEEEETKEVEEE